MAACRPGPRLLEPASEPAAWHRGSPRSAASSPYRRSGIADELERTFVPEIEEAVGPAPEWYEPGRDWSDP